jgi:two-component system sensor histidine kinase ChiS
MTWSQIVNRSRVPSTAYRDDENSQQVGLINYRSVILILFLSLLVFPTLLKAQTPNLSGGSVVIKRLSIEEGLSHRNVLCITQDSRGFIWIGTENGVNRYDGEKFVSIDGSEESVHFSDRTVQSLCGDKDGVVWIGTSHGLCRFNPATRAFKRYRHNPRDSTSLSADSIRCICIDKKSTMWVGTSRGLNRYDRQEDHWTRYYPNHRNDSRPGENYINSIVEDEGGTIWIATGGSVEVSGGGLFRLDRNTGRFTPVGPRMGVFSLYENRLGEFWAGVVGAGICIVDRTTGRFLPVALPKRDPGNPGMPSVNGFCEDRPGNLWIATRGWMLLRYDRRTKTFVRYPFDPNNPEGISSSRLTSIFADKDGLVWVGTERGGVNTVSIKPFLYLHALGDSLQLSQREDALFCDRDGYLWICSSGHGLWRFDPETGKSISVYPNGLVRGIIQDRDGIIWFEDYFSLLRYDPRTRVLRTVWQVPAVQGVRDRLAAGAVLMDRERQFWLGGNSSLYRVSSDLKEYTVFMHNPNDHRSITAGKVTSIVEDQSGEVWVSTGEGVNRFDKGTVSFTRFLHNENDSLSLSSSDWQAMCVARNGTIWIATPAGLNRLNETNSTFSRFIPTARGIPRSVSKFQEDDKGQFWYCAEGKIIRFSPSDGSFVCFDHSDGIGNVEILDWVNTRLKTGEIVFGTMDGILVFHPDSVRAAVCIPPIVITGIKTLNQPVRLSTSPELLQNFLFTHEENVFSISYAALSYDMPEYNQYAYRLEGFDKDWVYCNNRREAMYTNLDPGTYTFRVKGSNHDREWNEAGTSLTVIINPAYWQTWWFRILVILAIASFTGYVFRREVSRLRKEKQVQYEFSKKQIESQEAERKHLASELHDGLGQDLLVVNNELQQFLNSRDGSRDDLRRVASIVQESIEGVREISSNLHPHHIDRLGFCAAVDAMIDKVSHSTDVAFESTCERVDSFLPKESEIHIYRIIQESLSNIVKHSGATSARVQIQKRTDSIEVTVEDNGRGFDMAEFASAAPAHGGTTDLARGFGISSMSERARIIGGKLNIESMPKGGTKVLLTIPVTSRQ